MANRKRAAAQRRKHDDAAPRPRARRASPNPAGVAPAPADQPPAAPAAGAATGPSPCPDAIVSLHRSSVDAMRARDSMWGARGVYVAEIQRGLLLTDPTGPSIEVFALVRRTP